MNDKLGCFGWAVIIIILALVIEYWYIALAIAIIAGGIYYWCRKRTAPQREINQQNRDQEITNATTAAIIPDSEAVSTGIILKNDEMPYLESSYTVNWKEQRTHTTKINYSGVTSSIRIMKGVYWRSGSVKPMNEKTTQLETIHTGRLLLTNKRLVVIDDNGSTSQVMYSGINNIVPYSDAIGVMKSRGKDVYLTGNFDTEIVAIYLLRLVTGDLDSHDETLISADNDKLTVKDVFNAAKDTDNIISRLDEENKFYDIQTTDSLLTLTDFVASYRENPEGTRQKAQEMLNSLIDTSQILFEKTGDSDYSIRQYIGDTAFETLFVQLKNGQIEYYLLDDPNFLNLTNDKGTKDIAETSDVSSISPVSPTDEIRKYKELLDDGIITQDDFDKKKKQLLGI